MRGGGGEARYARFMCVINKHGDLGSGQMSLINGEFVSFIKHLSYSALIQKIVFIKISL